LNDNGFPTLTACQVRTSKGQGSNCDNFDKFLTE